MDKIYHGEIKCQATVSSTKKKCDNNAYYIDNEKYVCGVHSKKKTRKTLEKNPNKAAIAMEAIKKQNKEINLVATKNKENEKKGHLIVSKLRMMKKPEYIPGYLNVFPNFKHQNRSDGFGCMRLSPKALGPVDHRMPNLPPAQNIENYHQFAKFWAFELDEKEDVKKEFLKKRKLAYKDTVPYRHKYDKKTLKKYGTNINIPLCSIYYDKDGSPHKYGYLECRYFYCHWYEKLAPEEEDFSRLQKYLNDGYNLNIVGYDGYDVNGRTLWDLYNNTSRPFGHELALYTLLMEDDPEKYPWNKFYEENKKIYENVI